MLLFQTSASRTFSDFTKRKKRNQGNHSANDSRNHSCALSTFSGRNTFLKDKIINYRRAFHHRNFHLISRFIRNHACRRSKTVYPVFFGFVIVRYQCLPFILVIKSLQHLINPRQSSMTNNPILSYSIPSHRAIRELPLS